MKIHNYKNLTNVLDFWLTDFFSEIFKNHSQAWIFISIFDYFISISSMFHFDLFN
jgi:hypothetical protein